MKIGTIGAGMIGGTLARSLVSLGHDVVLANSRGPDTIRDLAAGRAMADIVLQLRHPELQEIVEMFLL